MSTGYNLDMVGVIEGTNKSSSYHAAMDFLRHYARLFHHLREEPINLIEIGVANGASLSVWKSFFLRARIIGLDVNPKSARFADERVSIEIGSQDDPEFLVQVCNRYPPSIIIDDGSHRADHIMCSFEHMFPLMLPGGLYVIEDLAIHFGGYARKFKGTATEWPSDHFLRIAHSLMARSVQGEADTEKARQALGRIDAVEFLRSAVIIHKKAAPLDVQRAMDFADDYLRGRGPSAEIHERLAQFIIRHAGPLDRAECELKRAFEIGGETPDRLGVQSALYLRQKRLPEAADTAERAAKMGGEPRFWVSAGDLRMLLGEHIAAARAYQEAARLQPDNSFVLARLNRALEKQGKLAEAAAAAQQTLVATDTSEDDLRSFNTKG